MCSTLMRMCANNNNNNNNYVDDKNKYGKTHEQNYDQDFFCVHTQLFMKNFI